MAKWKKVTLQDVTSILGDGLHGTPKYVEDGEYAFVNGNNLVDGKLLIKKDTKRVDESQYEKYKKPLNDRTIMVSINGTLGNVGLYAGEKVILGKSACYFNVKEEYSKNFIRYVVSTPKFKYYLENNSTGTTIKNASLKQMREYTFDIPESFELQEKIAEILKNIDDKIENNNQINRNLSEQAQALFKSWFVDLEPFDGEVPEEWTTGVLKDVLQLRKDGIKAGENTELPYLPIDVIPMNDLSIKEVKQNEEAQSSLITFNKNDILIGAMRVYFHRVVIAPFDGITRSTCFVLRPYDEEYLSFGLLCCNQNSSIEYAQSTSKGSTMPYAVWDNGFGDMEIVIPDKKTAKEFNEIIKPMLAIIQKSFFEIQRLQNLRDSLLPKLMSGELDVSDLDI